MRELTKMMYDFEVVMYKALSDNLKSIIPVTQLTELQRLQLSELDEEIKNSVKKQTNDYLYQSNVSLYYTSDTNYDIISSVVIDRFYHKKGGTVRGYSGALLRMNKSYETKGRGLVTHFDYVNLKADGHNVKKEWVYTYESKTMRSSHHAHDGVTCDDNGYFIINGKQTLAPGLFGDPSEDFNCKCRIKLVDEP